MKMKKITVGMFLCMIATQGLIGQTRERCGTMENHARLEALNPGLAGTRARIEAQTAQFVDQHQDQGQDVVYNIPVVVHVVYNTTTENISDAQIQSQLTVLNHDFRRLNADAVNTPSVWSSVAADCEINFCLATTDPNGNPTTGITRTSTSTTSFSDNDAMKYNSSGGKDAWPASKYLNLWVCDLGTQLLGYAQFPGGPAATDGVVVHYKYFGTIGTATAPFNKGRTATHEVGHWLNLYHIWGDDGSSCSGSDNVSDTPNQADENYGCPTFPTVSCSNGPNGDMFMNYMDYTDDACMNMFTQGQKLRMAAVLATGGARASLSTSNGCGSSTPSYCTSKGSNSTYEWIQSVAIGSYTHHSGNSGGYGDFSTTNVNLTKGVATNFTLTPGFASTVYAEYWKIWVDLNNDKDFDDTGELLYDAGSTSTTARTGSFTVPTTATATTTRMRISMKYNGAPTSCETFSYGEVEDYGVTLVAAASCGNPSSLAVNSITASSATLTWGAVTGATSYNVQYKTSGSSSWTSTTSTTTSKALSGLTASTTYNWQVQAVCGGGASAYVAGTNFTTSSPGCTDAYETNETSGTAAIIAVNSDISAKICTATDIDWFKFTTTASSPKVKITLTNLPADYDVKLYNNSLSQIGISQNAGTNPETITYNGSSSGTTYYVHVYGYNGVYNTSTSYVLRASTRSSNWRDAGEPEPTVEKDLSGITEDVLHIYPNPVAQKLFLNYTTLVEGDADISVLDLSGRICYAQATLLNPGSNIVELNVADLSNGMYLVRVHTSSGTRNAKVQVMH